MGRGLDGYLITYLLRPCAVFKLHRGGCLAKFRWRIASGKHLFPFRTEQLSHSAPMVLGGQPPGRVGRRRFLVEVRAALSRGPDDSDQLRAKPSSSGSRGAATPRPSPRTSRLLLRAPGLAPQRGPDLENQLLEAGCTGRCERRLAGRGTSGRGLARRLRSPGEFSQRALARTRRGLRSRSSGRRRRSDGSLAFA